MKVSDAKHLDAVRDRLDLVEEAIAIICGGRVLEGVCGEQDDKASACARLFAA